MPIAYLLVSAVKMNRILNTELGIPRNFRRRKKKVHARLAQINELKTENVYVMKGIIPSKLKPQDP